MQFFFICSILVTNVRNLFSAYTCIVVQCIKFSYVGLKVRLKYLHNLEPRSRLKVDNKIGFPPPILLTLSENNHEKKIMKYFYQNTYLCIFNLEITS